MTLQERVECGSPAKWTRKQLPKLLIKKFFIMFFVCLIPFWGQIGGIFFLTFNRVDKKFNGKVTDSYSADFGNADTRDYNIGKVFRIIYSIAWVAVLIASIAIGFGYLIWSKNVFAMLLGIFLPISILFVTISQLSCVHTFKYRIREYACPKCFCANSMFFEGNAGTHTWEHERLTSSTRSGEHRTHTVYVDGKEVGGIYASHSGYDNYETTKYTEEKGRFKCSLCGYSTVKTLKTTSEKVGERWERNNK